MLGVIPCAGEGRRWGGMTKELVPIGPGRWLIDNALDAMTRAGASRICIVVSAAKIHMLVHHLQKEKYRDYDIFYVIQRQRGELWEAITESFPYAEDVNLFAMPDTLFEPDAFRAFVDGGEIPPFALGMFETETPERFGTLVGDTFIDKPKGLTPGTYRAWGTLVWNKAVVDEWRVRKPADYNEAINIGVRLHGLHTFPLHYYYDFASWEHYCRWIERSVPAAVESPALVRSMQWT